MSFHTYLIHRGCCDIQDSQGCGPGFTPQPGANWKLNPHNIEQFSVLAVIGFGLSAVIIANWEVKLQYTNTNK